MLKRVRTGAAPKIYPSAIIMDGAEIGSDVVIGAFCFVANGARIGAGTRIQSHTSIWNGVTLEEDVFVGPAATFTNVRHPRVEFPRAPNFDKTIVERGASIGAHAVLVAPVRVGTYAMVGAGAVVTRDVPPHAIVTGNPARLIGWACECGETIARRRDRPVDARCTCCGAAFPTEKTGPRSSNACGT